jgi:hypothetical protein
LWNAIDFVSGIDDTNLTKHMIDLDNLRFTMEQCEKDPGRILKKFTELIELKRIEFSNF